MRYHGYSMNIIIDGSTSIANLLVNISINAVLFKISLKLSVIRSEIVGKGIS